MYLERKPFQKICEGTVTSFKRNDRAAFVKVAHPSLECHASAGPSAAQLAQKSRGFYRCGGYR